MDLSDFRKEYASHGLDRSDLDGSPIGFFETWFSQATKFGVHEPNAMTLATVSPEGKPTQRTVLLKGFDETGFTFFTNYSSRKATQIASNPSVSLLFPWITMERQVTVCGKAAKIPEEESAAYFASRPRDSQLGAWVSDQSEVIPSRDFLSEKLAELEERFKDTAIPLPPSWGGYRVSPESIEFWQGGSARIHDRIFCTLAPGGAWTIDRLSP